MNDPERQELLRRLDEADKARRRWKVLALAGTPILAFLLIISAGNAVTGWLALRETVKRERDERQRAMQAEEEARLRAEKVLKQEPPMQKEP